jgi:peptide/nickel transport system substrate-binding protein
MASFLVPASWALDPNLQPIAQDVEAAQALLAEAGWADTDGDGILDKDGVKFSFEILTNEGNTRRGQIAELVQQHLGAIGMEVEVSALDFNQLLDIQDAQTYDAIVLGWRNGYPDDPDWTGLFTTDGDVVGSGFNSFSYSNPEVDRLFKEANNVPGCAPEDRAPIYAELQKLLQDDQAYIWLFTQDGFYAANKSIENWSPKPNNLYWLAEDWRVAQ